MKNYEEEIFSAVVDLVRQWQIDGRNGYCLPVIRDDLLTSLEEIANDRASDNCNMCNGNKVIDIGTEKWPCRHCQITD